MFKEKLSKKKVLEDLDALLSMLALSSADQSSETLEELDELDDISKQIRSAFQKNFNHQLKGGSLSSDESSSLELHSNLFQLDFLMHELGGMTFTGEDDCDRKHYSSCNSYCCSSSNNSNDSNHNNNHDDSNYYNSKIIHNNYKTIKSSKIGDASKNINNYYSNNCTNNHIINNYNISTTTTTTTTSTTTTTTTTTRQSQSHAAKELDQLMMSLMKMGANNNTNNFNDTTSAKTTSPASSTTTTTNATATTLTTTTITTNNKNNNSNKTTSDNINNNKNILVSYNDRAHNSKYTHTNNYSYNGENKTNTNKSHDYTTSPAATAATTTTTSTTTATTTDNDIKLNSRPRNNKTTEKNGLNKSADPDSYLSVTKATASRLLSCSTLNLAAPQRMSTSLDNVQLDKSRDVTGGQKKRCAACGGNIIGKALTALNRSWHPEHFVCCRCRETIEQNIFFEKSGKIYCEKDYHSVFSPKCNKCLLPIFDMCVMALDKTWHLDHFTCHLCQKMLVDEDGFHEFNNNIYCRTDYQNKIAPRCFTCQQPIMDNFLSAMNKQWHIHCFVCSDCKRPISAESVYEHDGQPYCSEHYHKRRLCRCHTCHEAIFGAFVAVGCKKFHPDHFVCSFCRVRLSLGGFKIREGKYYCVACFNRLVG